MTGSAAPIVVAARVDPSEQAGVTVAVELAAQALEAVSGRPHALVVRFDHPDRASPPADMVLLSLLPLLDDPAEPLAEVERRLAERVTALEGTNTPVLLCNIFRHVRDRTGSGAALLARIRELNLLAIRLSQRLGPAIADIDRVLSYLGGRPLRSDYRPVGMLAADAIGYAIGIALLRSALDRWIDPATLAAAERHIGNLAAQPVRLTARERERQARHGQA